MSMHRRRLLDKVFTGSAARAHDRELQQLKAFRNWWRSGAHMVHSHTPCTRASVHC